MANREGKHHSFDLPYQMIKQPQRAFLEARTLLTTAIFSYLCFGSERPHEDRYGRMSFY